MADLKIYHSSLGAAKDEARKLVPKGYQLDEDDYFLLQHVSYGETGKVHARMYTEKGNEACKWLHVIVYRMESGNYELTAYLN